MPDYEAFTGIPVRVDEEKVFRWAALLVRIVFTVLIVGVILSAILWSSASADVGALALCIAFALCAGLLVIRQALLAERRSDDA